MIKEMINQKKRSLTVCTLVLNIVLLINIQGTSVRPQFEPSSFYIETGSYAIDTSKLYQNTSMSSVFFSSFSWTFIRARTLADSISSSIQSIEYEIDSSTLNLNISIARCSSVGAVTNFCLISTLLDRLKTLKIRYIAIDKQFNKFGFYSLNLNAIGSLPVAVSQNYPLSSSVTVPAISQIGTTRTFFGFLGFNVIVPSDGCFDLQITGNYSSMTLYYTITSRCLDHDPILYYRLRFSITYYNEETITKWPFPAAKIFYSSFQSPNSYQNSILRQYNTYWGLYHLDINDNSLFSWNSAVDLTLNSINGNRVLGYNNLKWSVLIIEIKTCTQTQIFYLNTEDLCYDICPQNYYDNITDSSCYKCINYECSTCDNITGVCLSCNDSNFRILINGRCDPIDGYFDNGTDNIVAQICNQTKCRTCFLTSQSCTGCYIGFYLNGDNCEACSPNCTNCTSVTLCLTCSNNFINEIIFCRDCTTIQHCISCNQTNCLACNPYYYLLNNSFCSLCSPNCSNCTSQNQCLTCDTNYINKVTYCLSCSSISHCQSCNETSCQICNDYYYQVNETFCAPICGDGKIVSVQQCDDGNMIINDGCSDKCTIEIGYGCTPETPQSNENNYYQLNGPSICSAICGDGVIKIQQDCDDNNTQNGDGCSSSCNVQTYFICNETSLTGYSLCYLTQLIMTEITLIKQSSANQIIIEVDLMPKSINSYLAVNWTQQISLSSSHMQFTMIKYDESTSKLNFYITYHEDIQNQMVQFNFIQHNLTQFKYVAGIKMSLPMKSDNNLALVVYNQDHYFLSKLVRYLSLGVGIFGILFIVIALFGGKIIGLETTALIQITFLSLISLDKMSPTFSALSNLGLSCGYNKLKAYDAAQNIQIPFKGIQWNVYFLYNFNFMSIFIIIPLIISIIAKILIKCNVQKYAMQITLIGKRAFSEYIFYGYLINAYLINSSLITSILFFDFADISLINIIGIALGLVLTILGAIITYLFVKQPQFFGQFKSTFKDSQFSRLYYLIFPIQRLINSLVLVILFNISFQDVALILIFTVLLLIIFIKRPYLGKGNNARPLINQITIILIQSIFFTNNLINNSKSLVSIYGPLIILGLLILVIIINFIFWIKNIKSSCEREKIQQETRIIQHQNYDEFKHLKAILFQNQSSVIMRKNNQYQVENQLNKKQNDESKYQAEISHQKMIQLSSIKNILSKHKLTPQTLILHPLTSPNQLFLDENTDFI